jgi:hypothetical protein
MECKDAHKNTQKEEIVQAITEIFMEMLLDIVDPKVQEVLKNFKTPKIKNTRRHRNK